MKFQVICRNDGSVEIHSRTCREVVWDNYYSDGIVEAANPFGAAIETLNGDEAEAFEALYFPCLAPDYEPSEDRPRRGRRPTRRAVPFGPDSDDDDVLSACYGKLLTWKTDLAGSEESARVFPDGPYEKRLNGGGFVTTFPHRQTKITTSSTGRRCLNFIDQDGTGFRAVALDTIVSVK